MEQFTVKRFYKRASAEETDLGFQVMLDGRPIKTQGGQLQVVQGRGLAERLAEEWEGQGEEIDPSHFAFRDMVDYAIDIIPAAREETVGKLLRYVETDTLCYRADPDEPLWKRQMEVWEPLLCEIEQREGVQLERVSGVIHRAQSAEALARLRARLSGMDAFTLAALEQMASLAASLCIGLAALEEDADGASLWDAANLEEDWQVEQWGSDEEAAKRRAKRKEDFLKAMEFARLARG
ncbi:MAG: ATP12 family protein [Erythrobacter sp.]